MGSLSRTRLCSTPIQYGPKYKIVPSIGDLENTGIVKRNANRQNPYPMNRAGRKVANAPSRSGGAERVCEKSEMCQNPMQNKHQNRTIGRGRRTRKMRQVTMTLNARATFRRSEQRLRDVDAENRKDSGKVEGNPREENPFAYEDKKLV
jgi:hypothetical protein